MARMKHSAMSAGILDAAIKKLKLKKPTSNTVPAKAELLRKYFKEHTPEADVSVCSNCKGESDFNLEACPYCGDSAKVEPTDGAIVEASGTEVLPADAPSTEELDSAVAAFKQKNRDAQVSVWEVGVEIARIHDGDLWKTRRLGKDPQYKTFKAFCGAELGISHTHAYNLIEIAKKFTREQVEQVGTSKLSIILLLPPAQREAALNGASEASKRALQAQADAANGKGAKVPDVVTIMARAGSKLKIPLICAAAGKNKGKPAKEIADDGFGEEAHENGVVTRYVLQADPKTGQLFLIITRRRE